MKPPKTISEQIELLKSRNLAFGSVPTAEQFLSNNNYYRVSGYWRKYQIDPNNGNDSFINGTTFEDIVTIYKLDTSLRNSLQLGIGIFEICFRSKFAHCMAHSGQNGQLSYLQQDSYSNKISQNEHCGDLLQKINDELSRSKERYVRRYRERGEDIPIWAAVEVLSFGTVSKMYSRWLDKGVVKETIRSYKTFKNDYESARHVIQSLVYLRNLCAHQARIWNREVVVPIANKRYLQKFGESGARAPWLIISTLMQLVDEISPDANFSNDVLCLCKSNEAFFQGLTNPTL